MAKFNIEIREVLSKVIILDAKDAEEAQNIAIASYREAKMDWVLGADDCVTRMIGIRDESEKLVVFKEY